jgi:glucans biosynthesis protein
LGHAASGTTVLYLRFAFFAWACLVALIAQPGLASAADPVADAGTPFSHEWLLGVAERMAQEKYTPPPEQPLGPLAKIGYDEYRDIRFRKGAAIWERTGRGFTVELFHPGFIYQAPVEINLVANGVARRVHFTPDVFTYGPAVRPPPNPQELSYSGFRVHYPLNRKSLQDEFLVFQGASYFRALGREQRYGLSARGLAIKTADERGEEFPAFTKFWIERPPKAAKQLVIYALLDSPSATGVYRFTAIPGLDTRIDVHATLFPRVAMESFGIAPLTSMFLFDPTNRNRFEDFRNAVHDSDGLQMLSGQGEHIWRPLANPTRLQISSFIDENPAGFGLMQRKRRPSDFEDYEARYDLRPSVWVEPLDDWGKGVVELVEIPSNREMNDNIVAFWRPAERLKRGTRHEFRYRMHWIAQEPDESPLALVTATRIGRTLHNDNALIVVDFTTPTRVPRDLRAFVSASRGTVTNVSTQAIEIAQRFRVSFELDPEDADLVELRLLLTTAEGPWSETWLYRWTR